MPEFGPTHPTTVRVLTNKIDAQDNMAMLTLLYLPIASPLALPKSIFASGRHDRTLGPFPATRLTVAAY
jgi:hypothetical protein